MQQIEASLGVPLAAEHATRGAGPPGAHRAPQGESHVGSLPAGRVRHELPAHRRRPPDRGRRVEVDRQRLVRLLGRRLLPAGRRGAEADDDHLDPRRAHDGRVRDDHRVGPRPRLVPRQERRERDHRPAVRPADDRRGARDHGALRSPHAARLHDRLVPLRRRRDLHARRDLRRPAVRHAALHRPHGAARADRARLASWRTRRSRSGRATSRRSGASCCRTSSRGSCRGSRWPSRGRSARSGRSS